MQKATRKGGFFLFLMRVNEIYKGKRRLCFLVTFGVYTQNPPVSLRSFKAK